MILHLERDLRRFLKPTFADDARWIEPALGSTIGLTDTYWHPPGEPRGLWLELKKATLQAGSLRYHVRPKQKDNVDWLAARGLPMAWAIAIQGTSHFLLKPHRYGDQNNATPFPPIGHAGAVIDTDDSDASATTLAHARYLLKIFV